MKFFYTIILFVGMFWAKPIYTPTEVDELELNVPAPDGWAVKHYNVSAGLKAIFWPMGFDPINADLMIFVFIGNKSKPEKELHNMDPFKYKCPTMGMYRIPDIKLDSENSLQHYFKGRCGRGMALLHIDEGYYSLIILLVSSQYLTTNQLKALDIVGQTYKAALIKAMGKDYYLVKDGVNEALRDKLKGDYKVQEYDEKSNAPVALVPATQVVPDEKVPDKELKTSKVLNEKKNDKPKSKKTLIDDKSENKYSYRSKDNQPVQKEKVSADELSTQSAISPEKKSGKANTLEVND